MAQKSRTIYMPFRGHGARFNEADLTPEYCTKMINWDIKPTGAFETISTFTVNSTINKLPVETTTGLYPYAGESACSIHELINDQSTSIFVFQAGKHILGTTQQFAAFTTATSLPYVFANHKIRSAQFDDKLILVDGTTRNMYTTDGSSISTLIALLEQGQISSTSASATQLSDSDITNWVANTYVTNNDLVRNLTKKGFGIVTGVTTAAVTHTRIDASALGVGALSAAATAQESGDKYQIEDLVELNIIPSDLGGDNVAVAGTNTSATGIYFTAAGTTTKFNWKATQVRVGDYILNTTRNAATAVTAITTSVLRTEGVATMVAGDTLVFLKSAMPIASYAHVHFNRLYMIDARDPRLIRISGPGDPQDMTVDAGTLDATSFKYGSQQSEADRAVCLKTFQRFLAVGGVQNVYLFEGTDPIADVTSNPVGNESSTIDFNIVATFPDGVRGPDSMLSIGNDLLYISKDGVQSVSQGADSSLLNSVDVSEGIKSEFIRDFFTCESIFHLPEKMWIGFHFNNRSSSSIPAGYVCVYNYGPYFGGDRRANDASRGGVLKSGTWFVVNTSAWDNRTYFVDSSGVLTGLSLNENSANQQFQIGTLKLSAATHASASAQNGKEFSCVMQTSWLTLTEPRDSSSIKDGSYITPTLSFERYVSGADVSGARVTIIACATDTLGRPSQNNLDYQHSTDIVVVDSTDIFDSVPSDVANDVSAGGRFKGGWKDYYSEKLPLMWHGQRVRFTVIASVRNTRVHLSKLNVDFNESGAP